MPLNGSDKIAGAPLSQTEGIADGRSSALDAEFAPFKYTEAKGSEPDRSGPGMLKLKGSGMNAGAPVSHTDAAGGAMKFEKDAAAELAGGGGPL